MTVLTDAICKFAADDSQWEYQGCVKVAADIPAPANNNYNIGGMNIDKTSVLMALLGAGALPGVAGMTGKMDMKQLILLALLGGLAGGGGAELYKRLGVSEEKKVPRTPGGLAADAGGGALEFLGIGAGVSSLKNGIFGPMANTRNVKGILTAEPEVAARHAKSLLDRIDPDQRSKVDPNAAPGTKAPRTGAGAGASMDDARLVVERFRIFAKAQNIDPNSKDAYKLFRKAYASGNLTAGKQDFDIAEEYRQKAYAGPEYTYDGLEKMRAKVEAEIRAGLEPDPTTGAKRFNTQAEADTYRTTSGLADYEQRYGEAEDYRNTGRATGDLDIATGNMSNATRAGQNVLKDINIGKGLPSADRLMDTFKPTFRSTLSRFKPTIGRKGVAGLLGLGGAAGAWLGS